MNSCWILIQDVFRIDGFHYTKNIRNRTSLLQCKTPWKLQIWKHKNMTTLNSPL